MTKKKTPPATIFTGAFFHSHQFGFQPAVAISRGVPRNWNQRPDLRLAPSSAMLKMDKEEYIHRFWNILSKLNPFQIAREYEGKIMLCWEPPNVFCHRRMVAEWLEHECGIVVPEWGYDRKEILPYKLMPTKDELEGAGQKVPYDKKDSYDHVWDYNVPVYDVEDGTPGIDTSDAIMQLKLDY